MMTGPSARLAMLDRLVAMTPAILFAVDAEGRWTFLSPAWKAVTGFAVAESLGAPCLGFFDPDHHGRWPLDADPTRASEGQSFGGEVRLRAADGGWRWVDLHAVATREADGRLRDIQGTMIDVTERRLADDVLVEAKHRARRAEQILRDAIDSLSEGFILLDAERRFVLCNRRYRELYPTVAPHLAPGVSYADLMRRCYTTDTDLTPEQREDMIAMRLNNGVDHYVGEQRTLSGRWTRVSDHSTKDGGIVGIRTDITLEKQQEEALRTAKDAAEAASRAKSTFLASMSHELRTPLNAIIGFSDLLAAEFTDVVGEPVFNEYLDDIRRSGRHLLSLINDILDVARFEAGRLDLDEEPLALCRVIAESVRLTLHAFDADEHLLSVSVPEPAPVLLADRRRLKQILINLLGNALKFTPPGGRVAISVRVRSDDAESGTGAGGEPGGVDIVVTDTGIGMDDDQLTQIGQPFIQFDEALGRRHSGTGLGLHISRALVEQHGGRLLIESRAGEGTRVTVRLPADRLLSGLRVA